MLFFNGSKLYMSKNNTSRMEMDFTQKTLKIGIIGAGFAGTSLLAALDQLATTPVEIFLFEKTGEFGTGIAYSTKSPFHLLNVRANDMSALETEKGHFVEWLKQNEAAKTYFDETQPIGNQFAPRFLYGEYLQALLTSISSSNKLSIKFITAEVINIIPRATQFELITATAAISVDKVVFALGNSLPAAPAFPVSAQHYIANPWQYDAIKKIPTHDTVILVGSGLTMVDSVLTLYHQKHSGKIIALSRHGLLPQPHSNTKTIFSFTEPFPQRLLPLMKFLRASAKKNDWHAVVNAFRPYIGRVWAKLNLTDRKKFLRHGMTYWNIHRHRVPERVMELLTQLQNTKQLEIISGRVTEFKDGVFKFTRRGTDAIQTLPAQWLINCMGPSLSLNHPASLLAQALVQQGITQWDALNLGFNVTTEGALIDVQGTVSSALYTLGSPAKGAIWECTAAPEIRKQSLALAQRLLDV
jgi:uncharacterized NAD(P)/FAD-binding protein YdhS